MSSFQSYSEFEEWLKNQEELKPHGGVPEHYKYVLKRLVIDTFTNQ